MTQPPDDRPIPDEPVGSPPDPVTPPQPPGPPEPTAAEPSRDAPTVAWSPPPEPPPPPYASAPPQPTTGWELPSTPLPPAPSVVPTDTWQLPGYPVARPMLRDGFVVASTGARFVAWLIDGVLAALVPGALALLVFDWNSLFRQMFDQMQFDANGRLIPNYYATYTIPITLDLILVSLIAVALQFLYFVGFWTSRWQATPGMVGLKLRVVDQTTGSTLTLMQATKRWIAMGYPIGLAILVPFLQTAASLAQFALNAFLFLSTVTDDRKQGLHDKFAGSQVIRHVSSGSGATVLGCFVYGIMLFVVWIAVVAVLVAVAGPTFFEYVRTLPRYTQ